jgi:hypothetical protein
MPAASVTTTTPSLSFKGLRCPKCRYDLSGLATPQCPECGSTFTHEMIRQAERRARWRQRLIAAFVMFVVMYAPYAWLLIIDYPWSDYRLSGIIMWPGLPVLIPVHALGRAIGFPDLNEIPGKIVLDVVGLASWFLLAWIGSRGRKRLIIIALVVLTLSLLNSWGLYQMFLM